MQAPTKKLNEVHRLLSAFPATASADPEQALRNYIEAVEDYPADDVEAGVTMFIKGTFPGFDGRFAPTAPMLATACRRAMEERLDRQRDRRPALPPPDKPPPTPEQRERAMALVRQFEAQVAANNLTEDAAAARRKSELLQRTNARFMPDMDEDALAERLGLSRGFSVGSPESEREAG
jgi:hypothetical protein